MTSRRVPPLEESNAWSARIAERRARGAPLLDLVEANPTAVGLAEIDSRVRAALAAVETLYAPDPRGRRDARAAVSAYYAERGLQVSPDDIVLTSGTSEAYAHLFRLLADPGDAILVPQPSYPLFEPIAALEGVRAIPYRLERQERWRIDFESLAESAGARARGIVVVQPNHPTGSCVAGEERATLDRVALGHGLAIVSDEVFGDFPWPGAERVAACSGDPVALPSLLSEAEALTFALSGISKVCGLPQLKLSWIVVAGPQSERRRAMRALEWIADLFLSVSAPVEAALPALLASRHEFQARVRARIGANLEALRNLVARRPELEALDADGGWVAVVRMPARLNDEDWALRLLDRGVVVHPGHFYDFEDPWFVVISLIVAPEIFAEGLAHLEASVVES